MNLRITVITALMAGAVPLLAQPPAAAPAEQAPRSQTPPPATVRSPAPPGTPGTPVVAVTPRREGQAVNIKVEFTLADQRGGSPAVKRTVTVVVADGRNGFIRTSSDVIGVAGGVVLNIDAQPELLTDGKVRLGCNLQYDWPAPLDPTERNLPRGTVIKTVMHDSVSLILENGKAMVVAQSADPIGDRQVTVEVKATVLR